MDKNSLSQQEDQLNSFLAEIFHKHNINCELKDKLLIFPQQRMTATARLFDRSSGSTVIVQLDIILEIGLGKEIIESCAGIGETIDAATNDAWKGFLRNSFHVLLSAFFTKDYDDQINLCEWNISGVEYDAFMGQISVRGQPDKFSMDWLTQFEEIIKGQRLSSGTHWIRLYYAQSGWEIVNSEVLLDNEIWEEVAPLIQNLKYPKMEEFLSARIFIVLKTKRIDISQMAAILAWMNTEDYNLVEQELIKSGLSVLEAEKAQMFIPLAFGRVFLKGLTTSVFPNEATIIDKADHKTEINLKNEPIYTEAYKLAEHIMQTGCVNKEHFQLIFTQSSEFNAYNNALLDGAKPEDLDGGHFGEPVIFLPHYIIVIPHPEERSKKSWKFWKKQK